MPDERRYVDYLIATGYPYELAGLVYFAFYIAMTRPRAGARFSQRSKILTLIASIALVGSVPFHYGGLPAGIAVMLVLVGAAMWSTYRDRRVPKA